MPEQYTWPNLIKRDGDDLFDHYRHTLEELGKQKGLLGLIFNKSQNKFQDPAKLRRLVVDPIENEVSVQANVSAANLKAHRAGRSYKEQWVSMSADVKGDAYDGLLEKNKNAQDAKSGAGQYFAPRPLIQLLACSSTARKRSPPSRQDNMWHPIHLHSI